MLLAANRLGKPLCCCGGRDAVGDGDHAVDEAQVATDGQGVEVDEPAWSLWLGIWHGPSKQQR